jgi:hypothetical protein
MIAIAGVRLAHQIAGSATIDDQLAHDKGWRNSARLGGHDRAQAYFNPRFRY